MTFNEENQNNMLSINWNINKVIDENIDEITYINEEALQENFDSIAYSFINIKEFINVFIRKGYKSKSFSLLFNILTKLKHNSEILGSTMEFNNSVDMLNYCILNITPEIYSKKIRKGRKFVSIPMIIEEYYKIKKALQGLKKSVKVRKEFILEERILKEILDCYFKRGLTYNKKQNLYNDILDNRPNFSSFKFRLKTSDIEKSKLEQSKKKIKHEKYKLEILNKII